MDFTAWLEAIKAFFGFATKIIPDDTIRDDNHVIRKPRLEEMQKVKIYNREFIRLKDHPEIPIALDVHFIDKNLADEDRIELIDLLTRRITKYRQNHPVIFHKWLKENNLK